MGLKIILFSYSVTVHPELVEGLSTNGLNEQH